MGDVYMVNGKILSGLPNHAKDIEFDNTGTTLNSTNTEDAIKEVNSNLSQIKGLTLCWENPSPTSSFSSQTVSFDKSKTFKNFLVVYDNFSIFNCVNGIQNHLRQSFGASTGKMSRTDRIVTTSNTGTTYSIAFTQCNKYTVNTYGTTPALETDNTTMIPTLIYGIEE